MVNIISYMGYQSESVYVLGIKKSVATPECSKQVLK